MFVSQGIVIATGEARPCHIIGIAGLDPVKPGNGSEWG
jgi:hypothetical protein